MSNSQLQTCNNAVKILRGCPYDHPYRAIRLKYADQIELQSLVGNPEYDDACVNLSLSVISAAQQTLAPDAVPVSDTAQ
jgi:hypothetical protein